MLGVSCANGLHWKASVAGAMLARPLMALEPNLYLVQGLPLGDAERVSINSSGQEVQSDTYILELWRASKNRAM